MLRPESIRGPNPNRMAALDHDEKWVIMVALIEYDSLLRTAVQLRSTRRERQLARDRRKIVQALYHELENDL